jgi:hypothetical protein
VVLTSKRKAKRPEQRKARRPDRLREMYDLYASGATLAEAGQAFGVTRERARQLFKEAGFKVRTPAEAAAIKRALVHGRASEIVTAFNRLRDVDRVAAELSVPKAAVREVLDAHLSETERRSSWKQMPKKYADDELVDFLRRASVALGGVLTAAEYDKYAKGRTTDDGRSWPTHQTAFKRFGSWRAALMSAGLAANPTSAIAGQRLFERGHCIDAVRAVSRDLGKVPTAAEYDVVAQESGGALPSQATVRDRCGKWNNVLALAGF